MDCLASLHEGGFRGEGGEVWSSGFGARGEGLESGVNFNLVTMVVTVDTLVSTPAQTSADTEKGSDTAVEDNGGTL